MISVLQSNLCKSLRVKKTFPMQLQNDISNILKIASALVKGIFE